MIKQLLHALYSPQPQSPFGHALSLKRRPRLTALLPHTLRMPTRAQVKTFLHQNGRLVTLCCILLAAFLGLGLRIATFASNKAKSATPYNINTHPTPQIPAFYDRDGHLLAGSVPTFSLYADATALVDTPDHVATQLGQLFPKLSRAKLENRLATNKKFIWIKRHITPQQKRAFLKKGIPGVFIQRDQKRFYPQGRLFSHVVGLRDIDGMPLSGLEKGLKRRSGQNRPRPVVTSLSLKLQHIMHDELDKAMDYWGAQAANGLLLDAKTGEILSMVSLPDFNPNAPHKAPAKTLFNRNISGAYEMGSVLKLHNVAMALEAGVTSLESRYETAKPIRLGRFAITDFRGSQKSLTFREAFLRSSNIVNAKVAIQAGADTQKGFFRKMGFFDPVRLQLAEISRPLVPKRWTESTLVVTSYGYSLSLGYLHLAQSVASIVTGFTPPLTLEKRETAPIKKASIRPQTVRAMNMLLRQAVREGHAKKAAVPGYIVGAKTGTANILENNRYQNGQNRTTCIATFAGPENHKSATGKSKSANGAPPRYVLVVSLERPEARPETFGFTTAGWNAAPTTAKILKRMAPFLRPF